jgi:hypothetical protein
MDYIKTGSRVGIVHVLPDNKLTRDGVPMTRADYLAGRAGTEGRTGTIIGFPAGHAGALWKVALDPIAPQADQDTVGGATAGAAEAEIKVYSPRELAPIEKLAEARELFLADQDRQLQELARRPETQLPGSPVTRDLRAAQAEALALAGYQKVSIQLTPGLEGQIRPCPGFENNANEGGLWVRGPGIFPSPDGQGNEDFDKDGWYYTRHIVRKDEDGVFWLLGNDKGEAGSIEQKVHDALRSAKFTPMAELSAEDAADLREAMAALGASEDAIPLDDLKGRLGHASNGPFTIATVKGEWSEIDTDAVVIVVDMRDEHEPEINLELLNIADYHFHAQLAGQHIADLSVCETLAPEDRQLAFKRVLFVFRHKSSVQDAVLAALRYADEHGFKNVVIPMTTFFLKLDVPTAAIWEVYSNQVRPALRDFLKGPRQSLNLVHVTMPLPAEAPQAPTETAGTEKR